MLFISRKDNQQQKPTKDVLNGVHAIQYILSWLLLLIVLAGNEKHTHTSTY